MFYVIVLPPIQTPGSQTQTLYRRQKSFNFIINKFTALQ